MSRCDDVSVRDECAPAERRPRPTREQTHDPGELVDAGLASTHDSVVFDGITIMVGHMRTTDVSSRDAKLRLSPFINLASRTVKGKEWQSDRSAKMEVSRFSRRKVASNKRKSGPIWLENVLHVSRLGKRSQWFGKTILQE